MSANVILDKTYNGVSKVQIPTSDGVATFMDVTETKDGTVLCHLSEDMNLKQILDAYPVHVDYENCLIFFKNVGGNVASAGTSTSNWHAYVVIDGKCLGGFSGYANGLSSADSIGVIATVSAIPVSQIGINDDNELVSTSLTNTARYYASGNDIKVIQIPFDLSRMVLGNFS